MNQAADVIREVNITEISPFPNHPFIIRNDELMFELIGSIKQFGVLTPAIVRMTEDGTLQMLSGHRRLRACEIIGLKTIPAVITDVDLDEATVIMVDSNLQRENMLPSEKAHAYKMKLDAMKKQGFRTDLTSDRFVPKSERKTTRAEIAETAPDSSSQIRRFIRLNNLIPKLLEMVDQRRIAMSPAVEISYLREDEQLWLMQTIESDMATPSLSQALRMKKLSAVGLLTEDEVLRIMTERKKPESWSLPCQ